MSARKHTSSQKNLNVVFRPTLDVLPHILAIPEDNIIFICRMIACTQNDDDNHLNCPLMTNKKDSSLKKN